ncbi:MAG: Y-family DNA polymerase [Bacteroidota bacterium]|nr:Y-family DNA polymerase [Bacteroidota bacterium]
MIGLVDCNNFYASCERVFNPRLNKKPVIVLSNNDGCVIARSNESKDLGIKMGEPVFKIKEIIKNNNIHVFSSNFSLYGDLSNRVMNTLKSETKAIEIYSIDEAFLDFKDFIDLDRAIKIKSKVQKWTGIPVSIGISFTKTLSKVANQIAKTKREGVCILDNDTVITRLLSNFPIEKLWGIGKNYTRRLKELNILTALDLREAPTSLLRKNFPVSIIRMQKELKGNMVYDLEILKNRKKSICTSRSFGKEINDFNNLKEAVCNFANNCARKLRQENSVCSKVSIFLMTNRFNLTVAQHNPTITMHFDTPTSDSMEIISATSKALRLIYASGFSYKKAGVVLHEIKSNKQIQMSCFDIPKRKKRNKLMKSIDELNSIMGNNKIRFASQGFNEYWQAKRKKLSPSYTTKYEDILKIKI